MKRKWRAFIIILSLLFLVLLPGLILSKKLKINVWFAKDYNISGIDVSHYQGDIDWQKIQEQNLILLLSKRQREAAM